MPSLLHYHNEKEIIMPNCAICKKPVTSGIVLCGDCAKGLAPYTLPTELAWFIDQLAEEIVLNNAIYPCTMCSMPTCTSQVRGLTCRNGVKAWLLSQAKRFFPANAVQGGRR